MVVSRGQTAFSPTALAGAYNFQSISAMGEKAVWSRETYTMALRLDK